MKKYIFGLLLAAACISCDPITPGNDGLGGAITADQLQITAKALEVDGVKSNKIILENHSPILSSWNYGVGTSTLAYDEVLVTSVGDITVTFTGRNGDGTTITKDIVVQVESIVFPVAGMDLFVGDGTKTWVFDAYTDNNHPYGIGGARGDKSPTWWGPEYGSFPEWDASMTFSLDGGAIFYKTLANGEVSKGSFSFNLTKKVGDWSQGILSLKGATIPNAVSVNQKNGDIFDFYIIVLDEFQLVLSTLAGNSIPDDPSGEANFWMFRPEGFAPASSDAELAALTGGSQKVWGWAEGDEVFGNGGTSDKKPGWWILPKQSDIDGVVAGEAAGATITFTSDFGLIKKRTDGAEVAGTFDLNMNKFIDGWSVGTLTTTDVTVLAGVSPNEGKIPVNTYNVISIDENKLVLGYRVADESEGWFWIFEPQK
jgi:hypothetical protein